MKLAYIAVGITGLLAVSTSSAFALIYCPQGQAYLRIGMTQSDVIRACGEPNSRQPSNRPATEKIPVTQLIYTSVTSNNPYPGINNALLSQWSLPTNITDTMSLQIDIINNKVTSVRMNGSNTNALTICEGDSVQVGDDVSQVYSACGNPDATNHTYINQAIPGSSSETWTYQFEYQPPFSLTFVNGSLESID